MAISKKLRFEVFKRDGFQCQYCGKAPPAATLEADHINPKSKKGKDDINNLITACFDCNRGKGIILLKDIPQTLAKNLEALEEKELQLKEYNNFLKKIENRIQKDIDKIENVFMEHFKNLSFTNDFRNSTLKRFLNLLPVSEVVDAMYIACNKFGYTTCFDRPPEKFFKYFFGICWKKIKRMQENG